MTTPDPNKPSCPHAHGQGQFHALVDVQRDTLLVFINVTCKLCGQPMQFPGTGDRGVLQGVMN